jgi:hypothetical protein
LVLAWTFSWLWLGIPLGYGLEFLPSMLSLERGTLPYWLLILGFASRIILSFKVKVLEGGFGLWLGDNIYILFMVKQAHLFF